MTESVSLVLPYPVSANKYWRSFVPRGKQRAIVVLSDEAKAYKSQVAWIAKASGIREPIYGRVAVEIRLYPNLPLDWLRRSRKDPETWDDDVLCIDLDNANKVLLDSLKGVVIDDDKWVRKLEAERMEPDGEARVEVRISRIQIKRVQEGLL